MMPRWVLHLIRGVARTRDKFGDGGLVTSSHDIELQSAGHVAIKDRFFTCKLASGLA